ncbi:cytochrome P450 [Trametes elegans]|nr:cytochrome P450 [Trametes elegans]
MLLGNMVGVLGQDCWTYLRSLVAQYGRVFKIHGHCHSRSGTAVDTEVQHTVNPLSLHSIFVKDHNVYEENAMHVILMNLTLGPGLLSTLRQQHHRQRKMLNLLFLAKQLCSVTPIFNDVVQEALMVHIKAGADEPDMLGWMGQMSLELIGQAGLGTSFDTFADAKTDEYAEAIKCMIQLSDVLHKHSLRIVNEKRAALEQGDEALKRQVGQGKDIMSVLLRANTSAAPEDRLSDEEVIAQVTTMALAGMDTTSNVMARILHVLSEHPDVQQKLREEVMHARDDGTGKLRDLDYNEVMGLPFLDAVCRETLRCYAPITLVMRQVLKDAVLPLSEPIRGIDGQVIDAIPVKKGMCILLDLLQSNCDPVLKPLPQAVEESRAPGVYSHI